MNKQDVCRQIAEKLEPRPSTKSPYWTPKYAYKKALDCASPTGHEHRAYCYDDFVVDRTDYEPFNPFDSAEDSERLLEAMASPNNGICIFSICQKWEVIKPHSWTSENQGQWRGCSGTLWATHTDRRTAIVLAACKWLGIEAGTL